jgi:hypothetical protein
LRKKTFTSRLKQVMQKRLRLVLPDGDVVINLSWANYPFLKDENPELSHIAW